MPVLSGFSVFPKIASESPEYGLLEEPNRELSEGSGKDGSKDPGVSALFSCLGWVSEVRP